MSLKNVEMFKVQLRAALRAGLGRNLRIMFPMVTKASEIRSARAILEEVRSELRAASVPFAENVEVGIMVEVPAAAVLADQLAADVDFFSIGTNDLSQYTLAMDRTNTELLAQVDALDPSVLRLISGVIQAGHSKGRKVGVCGELAGEPPAIPILLGFGLDEFSMNSPAIPTAKKVIRSIKLEQAREVAARVLQLESAEQVRQCVTEQFPEMQAVFGK
jgi:phosphoenolpyruvate-protein kinase (PTS system EI component)